MRRFACARHSSCIQPELLVDVGFYLADALFALFWLVLSPPTTTVCDEARSKPPDFADEDQAHADPHPVAHLIVPHISFRCVTLKSAPVTCRNFRQFCKSVLRIRLETNFKVCTLQNFQFARRSTSACLSKSCSSCNRRLTRLAVHSIILPLGAVPASLEFATRRRLPSVQLACVCVLVQVFSQSCFVSYATLAPIFLGITFSELLHRRANTQQFVSKRLRAGPPFQFQTALCLIQHCNCFQVVQTIRSNHASTSCLRSVN